MNQQTTTEEQHVKELTMTRTFNAKRELVFNMWTKPELFSKWYGPKGFTIPVCDIDLRPGGEFQVEMKAPNGKSYPHKGIYHEVTPPEKLVFSLPSHFDDNGQPQVEMLNSVIFTEEDGKTTINFQITEVKTIPGVVPLKGLDFAWGQSFDKLGEVIEK